MTGPFAILGADCAHARLAVARRAEPSACAPARSWGAVFPADGGGTFCGLDGQPCQPDPVLCQACAETDISCARCGEPLFMRKDSGERLCRECLVWRDCPAPGWGGENRRLLIDHPAERPASGGPGRMAGEDGWEDERRAA